MTSGRAARGGLIGRERELARVEAFLEGDGGPLVLLLTGAQGIGKTALLGAATTSWRARSGAIALTARPGGGEILMSFSALADLLDGLDLGRDVAGLPAPQRHALEVALWRAREPHEPPQPHAIAAGLLTVLRTLDSAPPSGLLIALDDVQWLDAASVSALAFAVRRLAGPRVRWILARRSGDASALERAAVPVPDERLELRPLDADAVRRLIGERFGAGLPRRALRSISEAAMGNPLYALELGRALAERGAPEIGSELVLPDALDDLLAERIAGLAADARRALLLVALQPDLPLQQVAEIAGPAALEAALDAELLLVQRGRARAAHPLLAAAVRRRSGAAQRRELHRALAATATDAERRARHLALATARPDASVAAEVSAAAHAAAARGGVADAVILAEHALRLTPERRGSQERTERLLALADQLVIAGEPRRVSELLEPEIDAIADRPARVRALLILADGAIDDAESYVPVLERALAEAAGDPQLSAPVLAARTEFVAVARVERIEESERWVVDVLDDARAAGAEVERTVLHALGWTRILRGLPVDDIAERFRAASDAAAHIYRSLDRVGAVRLAWRGETERARAAFGRLLELADERGEAWSHAVIRLHLCELELRVGAWDRVAGLLDEWSDFVDDELLVAPLYERCRALLAAGRGDRDDAERWAALALEGARRTGVHWETLEARRAQGIAALAVGQADVACERLREVWDHTRTEGVRDPGAFPVGGDLVEALAGADRIAEAEPVAERLRMLAAEQAHPWAAVTARRCDALVRSAPDELLEAASGYAALDLRFEASRCRLAAGGLYRRQRRWRAAREALEHSAAAFDAAGSPGWAASARAQLERVGARRPRPAGELTPTERRTAELAAAGLPNKEIAATLYVSVHTVEVHLSRAYAKLGIRSRAGLARALLDRPKD